MNRPHAPLLLPVVSLMAGIVVARWWMPPFSLSVVLAVAVLLALACWRWVMVQGVLVCACFVVLGLTLAQMQRDEPIEGAAYEAVVMSEPAERPKTVGVDLLLPDVGRTVRCYLRKDARSMGLRLGEGVVVSLMDIDGDDDTVRPTMYFVKSGDWQLGGSAVHRLSSMQRARLFFLRLRHRLLTRYQALSAGEEVYGVLAAMTLGDKSALTPEIRDAYNRSGVSHVLALSGLHVGMVYMLLTWLTLRRQRFWLSQVLTVTAIWAFAFVTGLSPSVLRAAVMVSIYAVFESRSRGRASLNVLAFAALVLLLADVQILFNVAFQMSFAALLAILLFVPLFEKLWCPRRRVWRLVWGVAAVSIAAQLGVSPLIAYYFGRFSTWFLLANFIVVPAATLIVYGSLLTLLFPPVGQVLVFIVTMLNRALSAIAALPFASIDGLHPTVLQVVLVYTLIAIGYLVARILCPVMMDGDGNPFPETVNISYK